MDDGRRVVLGLASGLLLALFAADRPIRVMGLLVVALSVVQALSLPALFRVPLPDRQRPASSLSHEHSRPSQPR